MEKVIFSGYFETRCFDVLAKYFPLVSFRQKTEPEAGSPCYKTHKLNHMRLVETRKLVKKRNGDFVVYTDIGVLKFWHDRSE